MTRISPAYTRAALAHLRRSDPVMARLIRRAGAYRIARRPDGFQALVRAIIFQQLAGGAARAIYERFVAMTGNGSFPTPAQVLAAPARVMRKAGLSRQKSRYLKDLAAHVASGSLDFRRFRRMDDETIVAQLTKVKGIGRWTAEMFLMFNLWRPDVLPVDDLGVRKAAMRAYGLRKLPTAKQLKAIGERWRPYRSVATWYLWNSADITLPVEPGPARRR
jgi:DNA-3-methyladenine glycosylase II